MQHEDEIPVLTRTSTNLPTPRYNTMDHNESPTESTMSATHNNSATAAVAPAPQVPRQNNNPIVTCLTILAWYCISSSIIWTTKWLFTNHFSYPLTVTAYSNFISAIWAALVTYLSGKGFQKPSRKLFWNYVAPIGLCTALEIGCSNVALKILSVSFGTILKGMMPVFTFGWGMVFGLEIFSFQIGGALVLIAGGIALASLGEGKEFQLLGFCLSMFSLALGGLRWAMTHKLLLGGGSSSNSGISSQSRDSPLNTNESTRRTAGNAIDENIDDGIIYEDEINIDSRNHEIESAKQLSSLEAVLYTTPMTSICVLPVAVALEWASIFDHNDTTTDSTDYDFPTNSTNATHFATSVDEFLSTEDTASDRDAGEIALILGTMTLIATLVFVLLMSEYWLVKATSSLTLSVAGVFKELLTIGGGIFFFSEAIDALNVIGFVACQMGILLYVCLRTRGGRDVVAYSPVTEALEEQQQEVIEEDLPPDGEDEDLHEGGPVFA